MSAGIFTRLLMNRIVFFFSFSQASMSYKDVERAGDRHLRMRVSVRVCAKVMTRLFRPVIGRRHHQGLCLGSLLLQTSFIIIITLHSFFPIPFSRL